MNRQIVKNTLIISTLVTTILLSGCSLGATPKDSDKDSEKQIEDLNDQIDTLKEDLKKMKEEQAQAEKDAQEEDTEKEEDKKTEEPKKEEVKKEETKKEEAEYLGPNFIDITTPETETYHHEVPVMFKGKVSPNTTKIKVKATSPTSPKVDDYVLSQYKAGSTSFSYGAKPEWNNLQLGTNNYEFTAYFKDGTSKTTNYTIYYVEGGAEMGKPVIYLYPEQETKVFVNVEPVNGISISDPAINDGWNVIATPEGRITNLADNKNYPYLFWEGFAADFVTPEEGFVVSKEEVASFFDEKLAYQGLNEQEIADFKEFWVPLLSEKPYYFITFIDQDTFDQYAPLTIEPKPDTTIRVFFDYKGLDAPISVPTQTLKKGVREGFTATEWGGRLYR